ncbi:MULTISPECIES: LysR family transcriptional regulator [Ureibacillus]|jgi:LysR family transcriptional regulator, low CO2-responsive transcriptional regulator|uniref:DNA-binding transcriptional LysR family regulator n=1 Tax=Ureibacillus thermosphaericus TaxID=51173 RepID=A0A840PZL7_URETH|nr:LysR family transcriptional regulator [Ureibacillus thermosphaericus]MBB5149668.1 DNA-binding transcriptional LysR family regulator [Ureibacillus thermosphaericus]NKZ32424.1 LysR family transcriptional regulator [Ureibacillus thermosphaericus]
MDTKQLRYFIKLVECMSYTKASEELHIAQPSLSIAMKKLESDVGYPLFEGHTRKLQLTDVGEFLYGRAKEILENLDILKIELQEIGSVGDGCLILGLIESAKHWIPQTLKKLKQDYPSINIKLVDILGAESVKQALRTHQSHVIITNQIINEKDIVSIPLYEERLVAVLSKEHHLKEKDTLELKDIYKEPFIISTEGFQTRLDVLKAFEMNNLPMNDKYEIERFETAISLVQEGLGVTILPENYLKGSTSEAVIQKVIEHPNLKRTVHLTYLNQRYLPKSIRRYIELVQEHFTRA